MHAYLIIAHNNFDQLQLLINLLDDNRNDIFIHIDKKIEKLPLLTVNKSKLFILDNRIDVRWGDVSQIQAELSLFETAINNNHYEYYHLISGVDLPIKTNDYVHEFFKNNKGKEFVGYSNVCSEKLKKNVCYYHVLTRYYRHDKIILKIAFKITRTILEAIINIFSTRNNIITDLRKGANWVSITHEFCKYIVERKAELLKQYKHTRCCDEIFIQTLLWNSPFKDNIYNTEEEFKGCMRLIDWKRGRPYVFGKEYEHDKKLITSSEYLFARKFDINKYPDMVTFVVNMINNKNNEQR